MDTAATHHTPQPDDHTLVAADFVDDRDFVEAELAAEQPTGWAMFLQLIRHQHHR